MPNRILREGILTSPRVAKLGWPEEVFYRRLHSVVDDFGRYYADHGMLRAACYPRQLSKVTDPDIGKWLQNIAAAGLVRVYPAQDGERYLEVLDFGQQVRAKVSKFPDPPSDCVADAKQVPSTGEANAPVFVSVGVVEDECVTARGAAPARRKLKTPMPDGFGISERVSKWAREQGFANLGTHLDAFRRKCAANGYVYADWDAALMEAIREDWAKLRGKTPNGAAPPAEAASASNASVDATAEYLRKEREHAALVREQARQRQAA